MYRWRFPCLLVSFLHASARGSDPAKTGVALHDCVDRSLWESIRKANVAGKIVLEQIPNQAIRQQYIVANPLLTMVNHSGFFVYQRKADTTD